MKDDQTLHAALEKAAKYICRAKCGLCPIREKDFQCPGECTVSTLPWQCWMIYFCQQAKESGRQ
ncbi:MAG: hypothetical protein ACOY4H_00700 [Thermodesulfobacteriota bacterium]